MIGKNKLVRKKLFKNMISCIYLQLKQIKVRTFSMDLFKQQTIFFSAHTTFKAVSGSKQNVKLILKIKIFNTAI